MKRVKLDAYFANNLGDDLMVDILLRKYPQCQFWVDSVSPATNKFLKHQNFENGLDICLKYGRLNHILNILTLYQKEDFLLHKLFAIHTNKCCCGVYIGGSLFTQWKGECGYTRVKAEERRIKNYPFFVIGANFGPYDTDDFRHAFFAFFNKCKGITFRDLCSYNLYKTLPNVAYAPDVVLNLQLPQEEKRDNTVIISVIDMSCRDTLVEYTEVYERLIVDICVACVAMKKKPVLMAFCEAEGDSEAIARIWNTLTPETRNMTTIYTYTDNLNEAVELLYRSDFIVATRFHAMILALRMKKPFYCISYNDKIKRVLDDIHCDRYCNVKNIASLHAEDILTKYNSTVNAESYIQQAAHQFDQFDRYIIE